MRLPGGICIDIQQAAKNREILLMENEGCCFPKVIIEALLKIMLCRTEDSPQELRTRISRDCFAWNRTVGCTTVTA